jgi:quercetin dioxygenase-like cupin family protein
MFCNRSTEGYLPAAAKVLRKTLVHGEQTLMSEFHLAAGAIIPSHSHPHEQTGYLIAGSLELTIGATTYRVAPGDSWSIPGHVEHAVTALQDCVALEVFAPVREDYLP